MAALLVCVLFLIAVDLQTTDSAAGRPKLKPFKQQEVHAKKTEEFSMPLAVKMQKRDAEPDVMSLRNKRQLKSLDKVNEKLMEVRKDRF